MVNMPGMFMPAPEVQSGERPTAESTGSESPVRAAPRARYLLLTRMACDQWQRSPYRLEEVSERGEPCPALKGTLTRAPTGGRISAPPEVFRR